MHNNIKYKCPNIPINDRGCQIGARSKGQLLCYLLETHVKYKYARFIDFKKMDTKRYVILTVI